MIVLCVQDGFLPPKDARKINLQQQMLVAFENYGDKPTLGVYNEDKKQYDHITYNVRHCITILVNQRNNNSTWFWIADFQLDLGGFR